MNIKRMGIALLLAGFLVLSFIYISSFPEKMTSKYRASELIQRIKEDDDQKRIDYLDSNGNITIAIDMGYSTKIITKAPGIITETCYDPDGNPVICSSGYCSICTKYDDNNINNVSITYLGIDGEPVRLPQGYSKEKNIYNEQGKKETVLYYDKYDNPVCSLLEGFGKKIEYNENGQIIKITYIDDLGNPMMAGNGYASTTRFFYISDGIENGKLEKEFYFDAEGKPVSLSLGQYGIHLAYEDEKTYITYLNADGIPMETTRGYMMVSHEYQGSWFIEKYYDINELPYRLVEGQYGIKKSKGQTIYLDSEGKEQFNWKMLLYNQPRIVIAIALSALIVSVVVDKRINILLFVFYCGVIIFFTLMYRERGTSETNGEVFRAYKRMFIDDEIRSGIIKNIWLFFPLGAIIYRIFANKKALIILAAISIIIELLQYITDLGWCELDDIISNTLGGTIGFISSSLLVNLKYRMIKPSMKH